MVRLLSDNWKQAQKLVATFLKDHGFGIQQEYRLKDQKRMDILALRKIGKITYHIIVEVKDWNKVSRKQEMEFCKQIINYLIEYALEKLLRKDPQNKWDRTDKEITDRFIGILCLTKDAHFSYRKVSDHLFKKNKRIQGIPLREQIAEHIQLYVSRFDFITKVFQTIKIPLYKESSIDDWISSDI
jgi:hypothetical protein